MSFMVGSMCYILYKLNFHVLYGWIFFLLKFGILGVSVMLNKYFVKEIWVPSDSINELRILNQFGL